MAIIKKNEFSKLSEKELLERKKELKLDISRDLANSKIGGSVKSPGRIREMRRTVARIEHRLAEIKKKK